MRDTLESETKEIVFKGKEALVGQETERLLVKGFESLWRDNEVSNTLLQRQLDERTKYFES